MIRVVENALCFAIADVNMSQSRGSTQAGEEGGERRRGLCGEFLPGISIFFSSSSASKLVR
jgi:hypothetical protein